MKCLASDAKPIYGAAPHSYTPSLLYGNPEIHLGGMQNDDAGHKNNSAVHPNLREAPHINDTTGPRMFAMLAAATLCKLTFFPGVYGVPIESIGRLIM